MRETLVSNYWGGGGVGGGGVVFRGGVGGRAGAGRGGGRTRAHATLDANAVAIGKGAYACVRSFLLVSSVTSRTRRSGARCPSGSFVLRLVGGNWPSGSAATGSNSGMGLSWKRATPDVACLIFVSINKRVVIRNRCKRYSMHVQSTHVQ